MKQFENALKVLFSSKERYLLRVQHDSTLICDSEGSDCKDSVDSEDEKGPLKNPDWW